MQKCEKEVIENGTNNKKSLIFLFLEQLSSLGTGWKQNLYYLLGLTGQRVCWQVIHLLGGGISLSV